MEDKQVYQGTGLISILGGDGEYHPIPGVGKVTLTVSQPEVETPIIEFEEHASERSKGVVVFVSGQRAGRTILLAKMAELAIAARELTVVMASGARRMEALCETMRIAECCIPKLHVFHPSQHHIPTGPKALVKGRKPPNLAPFWGQKPQKTGRKHR